MLPLIILTFLVFLTLWIGDFYLTVKSFKKSKNVLEINPIMLLLLKFRSRYVVLFKLAEISIFFYLIYYLTILHQTMQIYILLAYIVVYGVLVANNSHVYYKAKGKPSFAINIILIFLSAFVSLFIFLNFLLYSNLTISYDVLSQCKDSFNNLYRQCQQQNATPSVSLPQELESILESINLTIRRPFK